MNTTRHPTAIRLPSRAFRVATLVGLAILFLGLAGSAQADSAIWTATATPKNWNDNANWNPNTTFPNGTGDVATLINNVSVTRIINLNTTITIGKLIIGNPYPKTITIAPAGGSLTFAVLSGRASVVKTAGYDDTISSAVTLNDDLVISNTASARRMVFSGIISGDKRVIVGGSAYTAFSGANTFTGGLTLDAGAALIPDNAKAFGTGRLIINGGGFYLLGDTGVGASCAITPAILQTWNASFTTADGGYAKYLNLGTGAVTLSNDVTVTVNNTESTIGLTVGGTIDDEGNGFGLTKAGVNLMILNGVCTYGGGTVVSAGTLRFPNANTIPNGSGKGNVTVNGTLQLANDTINGLSGTGIVTRSATGLATLTVGDNDQTASFGGVIGNGSGVMALIKAGAGVQTLSGTNSYSGTTIVTAGTLRVSGVLGTNTVSVGPAGTLDGTGTIPARLTTVSGVISAGDGEGSLGALTVSNLSLKASSLAVFELGKPANNGDKIVSTGSLSIESGAKIDLVGTPAAGVYQLIACTNEPVVANLAIRNKPIGWNAMLGWDGSYVTATLSGGGGGTVMMIR